MQVKRHVVGVEAVSAICEDLGIAPNLFYRWQKELFDHGSAAFEVKGRGKRPDAGTRKLEKKVESLETKLSLTERARSAALTIGGRLKAGSMP